MHLIERFDYFACFQVLVYVCHGFAEYLGFTYEEFIHKMVPQGDAVAFGHDHLGHGHTGGQWINHFNFTIQIIYVHDGFRRQSSKRLRLPPRFRSPGVVALSRDAKPVPRCSSIHSRSFYGRDDHSAQLDCQAGYVQRYCR